MLLGAGSRACLKKALEYPISKNSLMQAWLILGCHINKTGISGRGINTHLSLKSPILLFTITIKILVGSHEFYHCKVTDPTESLSTISTQVLPRFSWISWPLES